MHCLVHHPLDVAVVTGWKPLLACSDVRSGRLSPARPGNLTEPAGLKRSLGAEWPERAAPATR